MFKLPVKTLLASAVTLASPTLMAIEEITVSADFIDGSINQLAGSLSAVDDELLNRQVPQHLDGVLDALVNVSFSSAGSRGRFMQVRGVGDLEQFQDPKNYPSVVATLNGVELGDAGAALLFDVDQVSLARGPQATSQGAVGHAGALALRSVGADSERNYLQLGLGSDGLWQAGVAAGAALGDGAVRLALYQSSEDGQTRNLTLNRDDTAGRDEQLARLTASFKVTPLTEVGLTAQWLDADNGYDAWSLDDERATISDQPGSDQLRHALVGVTVARTHYSGAVSEIMVSHSDGDSDYGYDADWVFVGFHEDADRATERFLRDKSHTALDLRWNSAATGDSSFTAGLYLRRADEQLDYIYNSVFYGDFVSRGDYESEQQALYGQWRNERGALEWIAAARLERFSDDYRDSNAFDSASDEWLRHWAVTANYRPGADQLWYARLAQSQKPGGINTSASANQVWMSPAFQAFTADKLRFDSEQLRSLELGYKWQSRNAELRATLFYNQRNNAQLESWMWDDGAGLWIGYLDSTTDADNYGLELEWQQGWGEQVSSYVNLGLLRTEVEAITSFDLDQWGFNQRRGRDQAKSPRYQYSAGVNYRADRIAVELQLQGADNSYYGYYHDGQLPGYHLLNLFVSGEIGGVELSLWGRNLADRDYAVHGLYFAGDPRTWINENYRQLAPGRSFGASARWQF